uniref:fibroblast growth factor 6 isoform X1 n=1 Tax=Nyctereutes procyonoides TaxID=34880 RepID=UPI0024437756|nr:fibroblast growth factor 6 isoform X1 [Nyctereutes procyonoides]
MSRGAGRLQGTLWALVFLGVLVGMVVPLPAGTHANSTLLDSRGWGTLLSRSRAGLAGEIAGVNWESGYLVGIKRQRRLYCNVGIGFHLQVPPDGRISGTHEENPYSLLEISTVERGVVSLFGVKSALFVAMNSKGRLYTTPSFQEECKFRETLLPNNYNAYESDLYRGTYIALSKYGRMRPSIDRPELSDCELDMEVGHPTETSYWLSLCPAHIRKDICWMRRKRPHQGEQRFNRQ